MVPALRIRGGGKFPVSKMMKINTRKLLAEDRVAAMEKLHTALPFLDDYDDKYTLELKAARAATSAAAAPQARIASGGGAGAQSRPQRDHDARAASRAPISTGGRTGFRSREAASIVKELTHMLRKASADGAGRQLGRVSVSEIGDVAGRLQRVLGAAGASGDAALSRLVDAVAAHLALALRGAEERDAFPALHALARLLPPPEGSARAPAAPHDDDDASSSAAPSTASGRGAAALAVATAR
ncbi:hypothetical protein T484DRAFT_1786159, partial [Baffinella frigidus]